MCCVSACCWAYVPDYAIVDVTQDFAKSADNNLTRDLLLNNIGRILEVYMTNHFISGNPDIRFVRRC